MDPAEEQEQELEVLRSIYPDELEEISPTHFTIRISLDTETDRKHAMVLDVRYPEQYPEVAPLLDVQAIVEAVSEDEDLDSDDDEKFVSLAETIDFEKPDIQQLVTKLNEEAEMNVGIPSVFAVAALLKDEAELLLHQKINNAQKKYDEALLAREAEEQKKFHGTAVTKESFSKWRHDFRAEMKIDEKDVARFEKMHNGKMTGREIFEKGLAGEEDEDDNLDDLADAVAKEL